jgi:tetratricopeptide (TPR) repeat protein
VQQFAALRGLWNCHLVQTTLQQARELGEHLLALAQRALGTTLFWLGEFPYARLHLEHGLVLATPQQPHAMLVCYGEDSGLVCRLHLSLTLWVLGYPDQALQQMHEALRLTQALAHPFSQAFALVYAAWLHQYRRELQLAQARAERAMAVATEYGLAQWLALGTIVHGWALAAQGRDPRAAEAEGCFHQALDSARQQQAKARELPTALSVSRLWQAQGKAAAARTLLAEVSGWFTEGFDTADLPEAQTLLQALGRNEMDPPPVRNLPVLGNTTLCISPSQNPSTAHPSEIQ